MNCLICGKPITFRRTLKTLFKDLKQFSCLSCAKKYKTHIITQIIPKDGGVFKITSLFSKPIEINLFVFYNDIQTWFRNTLKVIKDDDLIIWVDDLTIELLEVLEEIKGHIYILTKDLFQI